MSDQEILREDLVLKIGKKIDLGDGGAVQFGIDLGFQTAEINSVRIQANVVLNPAEAITTLLFKWINKNGSNITCAVKLWNILIENGYVPAAEVLGREIHPDPPSDNPGSSSDVPDYLS